MPPAAEHNKPMIDAPLTEKLGICQWFHFEDEATLARSIELLRELGVKHLRTGISWADYHRDGGLDWYKHLFESLREFEILLSVWHTPPSISESGRCASPPRRLLDYADFIDRIITSHGDRFATLELWNEPNNRYKWDFENEDPEWRKFGEMVGCAGHWARRRGVTTVLGGMMPVDPHWLELMDSYGALEQMDIVAIHGFPGMWWPDQPNWDWYSHWDGWAEKIEVISSKSRGRPVWVTESGYATYDFDKSAPANHDVQIHYLNEAAAAPTPRLYWYCLIDLNPARDAIEGYHVDENEYHLGLVTHAGERKPAFHRMRELLA